MKETNISHSTTLPSSNVNSNSNSSTSFLSSEKGLKIQIGFWILYFIVFIFIIVKNPNQIVTTRWEFFILLGILTSILFYIFAPSTNTSNTRNYSWLYYGIETIKFLGLLGFLVLLIMIVTLNPNQYITNFPDTFLILIALLSGWLFYKNIPPSNSYNTNINHYKFDILKFIGLFVCYVVEVIFLLKNSNPNSISYIQNHLLVPLIFLLLIPAFVLIGFLLLTLYSLYHGVQKMNDSMQENRSQLIKILTLFSFITFGTLLLVTLFHFITGIAIDLSFGSSYLQKGLRLVFAIIVATLLYKMISTTTLYRNSNVLQFLLDTFFYLPCLLLSPLSDLASERKKVSKTDIFFLGLSILLLTIYQFYPKVHTYVLKRGGILLLNQPVYTNEENILASYIDLNGSGEKIDSNNTSKWWFRKHTTNTKYQYHYGLCCWIYLNSTPASTYSQNTGYQSLINYGNKPNVLYNKKTNTLMITMKRTHSMMEVRENTDHSIGNIVIYKMENVPLQKWLNIIINYNGGTLDIFINGELVKSYGGIVPYMNYDNLTIGSTNGVGGGICSVLYFPSTLTLPQIQQLYNDVKDHERPLYSSSMDTFVSFPKQT